MQPQRNELRKEKRNEFVHAASRSSSHNILVSRGPVDEIQARRESVGVENEQAELVRGYLHSCEHSHRENTRDVRNGHSSRQRSAMTRHSRDASPQAHCNLGYCLHFRHTLNGGCASPASGNGVRNNIGRVMDSLRTSESGTPNRQMTGDIGYTRGNQAWPRYE